MNIIELLRCHAKNDPDKMALIHGQRSISYRQLDGVSRHVAESLQKENVLTGQKVLLFIPLGIDLYIIFLALLRRGITVVLIDPSAGKRHMQQCIKAVTPDALIATPKAHLLRYISAVNAIPRKFSLQRWVPGSRLIKFAIDDTANLPVDVNTSDDHPALITFTSGSTGIPKGIVRSHGFLKNQHEVICQSLPSNSRDIELNTLPVFIFSNIAKCMTTVIPDTDISKPAFVDAKKIVKQLKHTQANRLLGSPAFCRCVADHLDSQKDTLNSITKVYTGGGPVFPNLLQQLSTSLPYADIIAVYGSTEAEPIAKFSMNAIDVRRLKKIQQGNGLFAGKPVSAISIAILPDRDGCPIGPFTQETFIQYRLAAGKQGEIAVSGSHVQQAYMGGHESHNKFTVNDTVWHRTGDAGYLDENGYLWLLGRCVAKIEKRHKTIYPLGLEAAAMSFSGVRNAAAIELAGTTVLAIETRLVNTDSLCEKIKASLADVESVKVVKKVPVDRRHNSKVVYSELRKILLSL